MHTCFIKKIVACKQIIFVQFKTIAVFNELYRVDLLWELFVLLGVGHDLVIEFSAYKEKLVKEELILSDSSDSSKEITIVLNARVLGMV